MRFVLVGGFTVAVYSAVLVVLVEFGGVRPFIAAIPGFTAAAVVNYIGHYFLTFRSDESHKIAIPKFVFLLISNFLLNVLLIWLLTEIFFAHYIIAQFITLIACAIFSYVVQRIWIF